MLVIQLVFHVLLVLMLQQVDQHVLHVHLVKYLHLVNLLAQIVLVVQYQMVGIQLVQIVELELLQQVVQQHVQLALLELLQQVRDHALDLGVAQFAAWQDQNDPWLWTEIQRFDSWNHYLRLTQKALDSQMLQTYEALERLQVGEVETQVWTPVLEED